MRNWNLPSNPPKTSDDVVVLRSSQDVAQVGWYHEGLWHVFQVNEGGDTGRIITAVHVTDIEGWLPLPAVQPAVIRSFRCS